MGSTLTTASNSSVLVTNGAQGCAVYWQVGSSATLGSGTQFKGTIVALTSITMVTGATVLPGRALARNGAVTLDSNRIEMPAGPCSATPVLAQMGGGPPQGSFPWWILVLIGVVACSVGALGFGPNIRGRRRST